MKLWAETQTEMQNLPADIEITSAQAYAQRRALVALANLDARTKTDEERPEELQTEQQPWPKPYPREE
eukprot:6439348-Lingulodinium_polyedra.AAC.2